MECESCKPCTCGSGEEGGKCCTKEAACTCEGGEAKAEDAGTPTIE